MASGRHVGASCFCFDRKKVGNASINRPGSVEGIRKDLIHRWFKKSLEIPQETDADDFEAFVFAWFSFNAWASCVTQKDFDREYMERIINDPDLAIRFEGLVKRDNEFDVATKKFAKYWPITRVSKTRTIQRNEDGSARADYITKIYATGETHFEPKCCAEHIKRKQPVTVDWQHTIAAIYRVRCNLFHGEKGPDSQEDRRIVSAANKVLIRFVDQTNCFGQNDS